MANNDSMDDIQNLFKETIAEFMENGLEAELDEDLGYSKYDYKNKAKDTSNKIRAVFKSRMQDGKRCSGSIPYGYKRFPGDKQTLHVDEEAASVVRRIFDMAASGASLAQIGQTLSDEKVLIPSAYEEQHHPEAARNHSYHDPYRWNTTTLTYILDRQEYLGHTVLCKSIREKAPCCNPGRKDHIQKHS